MKRIFLFFIGYARLLLAPGDADAVTKMCFELKIPVFIGRAGKYHGIAVRGLTVKLSDINTVYRILDEAGASPVRERRFGVPALFSRYKLRFGIFAGAILTALSLFLAGKFVWRIEIVGNESVSDEDIIAQLDAVDFRLGTYIDGVDFDEMHNVLLMNSENLSWISVNMRGSVAYVEVREYSAGDGDAGSGRTDGTCANIISSLSGTVTQVSVREGRSAVKIGDEVTEGQLLITGVMEYTTAPTKYVYAEGEVFVRTERSFTVTVPLKTKILVETDDVIREYGIKIFSKEIFFGIGGSIDTSFYDTIIMYGNVDLFGTVKLPVSVITVTHTKSESKAVTLTEAEAAAAAYAEYHTAFIGATEKAELLAYQTEAGMNEAGDAYVITCVLTVIADAALTLEFEVTP